MLVSLFSMTFVLPPLLLCEDVQDVAYAGEGNTHLENGLTIYRECCPRA
jgi:hypothetical protein